MNFKPNLTAHVQPKDQGIIQCFKVHYHTWYIQYVIDQYDTGITPRDIYDINQLKAMWIADDMWCKMDTTIIWHWWCKAGILPQDAAALAQPTMPISALLNSINHDVDNELQNNPIINTECKVESAIEELISTGVLQKENWMDINALLNPAEEIHLIMEETSDEQIYQAVMDAWGAL